MSGTYNRASTSSRARVAAYSGISVALIAISAWIVIPIGPIPFTLQMLAIPLVICLLPAKWATIAIFAYVLLGALGAPVFSGFRGGLGVILGPTGGFLLGYLIAVPAASMLLAAMRKVVKGRAGSVVSEIVAGLVFTAIAYLTGWLQYAAVSGIGLEASLLVAVVSFILPDVVKVVLAVVCAQSIESAVPSLVPVKANA